VKVITLLATLGAATLPLFAQETVRVHLVEVPVTVVDGAGNPIRGLTSANFELFDEGRRQKITAFDAIDFTSMESMTAISPLNPNARRAFLLLFDIGYSSLKAIARARVAAKLFIAANVLPRDLVAVASVDPERGFRLLTAFTTDRNLVQAAIAKSQEYRGPDPLQLSDLDSFGNPAGGSVAPPAAGGGVSGHGAEADAQFAEVQERSAQQNLQFASQRAKRQVNYLVQAADILRSVPGRKQLVLLSGGFDAAIVRGRAAHGTIGNDMDDMNKATSGKAYSIDNDARFGVNSNLTSVEATVSHFKRSDVVMNAIDIEGIGVDGGFSAKPSTLSNDALHFLADPTGGTVFENSNDLHSDFVRMMHQQEVVYVLAFQAQAGKPGKLHNLSVKTVGVPAYQVHSRPAYYEAGGETPIERYLSNAEIVVNDIPQYDIRVAALAAAVPSANRSPVPVFVEINGPDLLRDVTKPAPVDIFIYAFDEQGVVRDRTYQRFNLDPAKASAAVREGGIKYYATLTLLPGRYALRTLVTLPDTQRRGFARTNLLVPRQDDMTVLTPLFLDKPGQWSMLKGVQHDNGAAYPFQLDGKAFVPSAAPILHPTETREFVLYLYNSIAEDVIVQATVTDWTGKTRPAEPSLTRQVKDEGVTKLVFQYNPSGLPAGPATLDVSLHKKESTETCRTSIPLVVASDR
jgi:VWFA-related protein